LTTLFIHPKLSLLKKPLVAASGQLPPMLASCFVYQLCKVLLV
jgi:hypothetical protein